MTKEKEVQIMSEETIYDVPVPPEMDDDITEKSDAYWEEITLDSLGSALKSSTEGSTKPEFAKNTPATIIGVKIKKAKRAATTKDGRPYVPLNVTIETQTDDGLTSYDNYSGLRETEEGGLWCGEKSQFGRLIQLIKEEDDEIDTFDDVFRFLKTPGLRVKIKTTIIGYRGQEYKKNLINQFI